MSCDNRARRQLHKKLGAIMAKIDTMSDDDVIRVGDLRELRAKWETWCKARDSKAGKDTPRGT